MQKIFNYKTVCLLLMMAFLAVGCAKQAEPVKEPIPEEVALEISTKIEPENKGTLVSKEGLAFNCPLEWAITQNEQLLTTEFQIACEKQGPDESGLAIIKGTQEKLTAEEYLIFLQGEYQSQYKENQEIEVVFGKVEDQRISYEFEINKAKYQGWIETKECSEELTIGWIFQEDKDDHTKNKEGFEKIRQSIGCE